MRSEGLCQRNISMTPSGIEPATFRFVAQHLNHCATAVNLNNDTDFIHNTRFSTLQYKFPRGNTASECSVLPLCSKVLTVLISTNTRTPFVYSPSWINIYILVLTAYFGSKLCAQFHSQDSNLQRFHTLKIDASLSCCCCWSCLWTD